MLSCGTKKGGPPISGKRRIKVLPQLFAWANSPEYCYATKNPAREVIYIKSGNPDGLGYARRRMAVRGAPFDRHEGTVAP